MKKYLIVIALFASICALKAQNGYWEEVNGPYGGIAHIVSTPTNVVYSVLQFSVYRSADYGETWEKIFVNDIDTLSKTDEVLSIGSTGLFYNILSYFDGNNGIVYELYTSENEGLSWTLRNGNLPTYNVKETPSGDLIGFNTINNEIFRSTDGGISWQMVHTSPLLQLGSSEVSTTPDGKILISGNNSSALIYSHDNGLTWAEGDNPSVFSNCYLTTSGTIFAVNTVTHLSDLYRTSDLGATWDTISFNLGINGNLNTITNLNNGKLLLSSSTLLFLSEDDGLTWTPLPFTPEQANGFAQNTPLPNGDILGFRNEALFRSSDEGANWSFSAFGHSRATVIDLKAVDQFTQFAVTKTGLWRTEDAGVQWNRLLADTATGLFYQTKPLALINADSFAVLLGKNIWGSQNGGQTFEDLTPAGGFSKRELFVTSNSLFFCTGNDGVLKKSGFSGDWSLSIPNGALAYFAEHPSGDLYTMTRPLDNSGQNLSFWRSQNAGETWEIISVLGADFIGFSGLYIDQAGKIYVNGYNSSVNAVAISEDNGANWDIKAIPYFSAYGSIVVNAVGQIFTHSILAESEALTTADEGESWYYLPYLSKDATPFNHLELASDGYLFVVCDFGLLLRSKNSSEQGAYISGQITKDADQDCSTPDAQQPLKNWILALEGMDTYYNTSNAEGRYTFFVDTGTYTIRALAPQNLWWSLCDSIQTIEAHELSNIDTANFVAIPMANCPLMTVNVAIPQLRRCFENQVYLEYCNQGTETADSAWVDVMLDPYLSFVSSPQPHEIQPDASIRFFIGDVPSGACNQFQLRVYVNCDSTVLGQTHCIFTHSFPDTLCTPVPNWSGANIDARVECQDSIHFTLRNTGVSTSQTLDFIIFEDDVVLMSGQESYDIAEDLILSFPANGHTWRIESEQEPGHPFSNLALAFSEGCGGFNSLGYVNQFPVNGIQPSWHRMCVENTGSFDPNDKQGFPNGVGPEHNIRPGQTIDYLIRFQNTGTDTAFTVVIRDTLSSFLDPLSIRVGASSHAYTWDLIGEGVLKFSFNNIMLPDSNINEAASHGFVQFSIAPYSSTPLGSVIENDAAIYFDFNEPVITNTTWHTIKKSPLISATRPEPQPSTANLDIWPNPCRESAQIQFTKKSSGAYSLSVYDNLGNQVAHKTTLSDKVELRKIQLPPGFYWVEIRDAKGQSVARGKLVKE